MKTHILKKDAIYCHDKPQTLCGQPGWALSWYDGGIFGRPRDKDECGKCFAARAKEGHSK